VPPRPQPLKVLQDASPGRDSVILRNSGHCLYDLTDLFAMTLLNVSNVGMQDFSMVSIIKQWSACRTFQWLVLLNSGQRTGLFNG